MADKTGVLKVRALDVFGDPVSDTADISLRHQTLTDTRIVRQANISKTLRITQLYRDPEGRYAVEIDPLAHLPVAQFVIIRSSGDTVFDVTLPVEPKKVVRVEYSEFANLPIDYQTILEASQGVSGFGQSKGKELYDALDDISRGGLLNILAKCSHTKLANDRLVVSYVQAIREIRGDRFFASVTKQLRDDTKNSVAAGLFYPVPEILHRPPDGYEHAGSFKTFDRYGNLQLTFHAKADDWVADIDIDDANGLEHVFQVLRNAAECRPTHPYDIHEILVYYQKIIPEYRLFTTLAER
jgi:hypothetical protein